jgi:hypothetical protein
MIIFLRLNSWIYRSRNIFMLNKLINIDVFMIKITIKWNMLKINNDVSLIFLEYNVQKF